MDHRRLMEYGVVMFFQKYRARNSVTPELSSSYIPLDPMNKPLISH